MNYSLEANCIYYPFFNLTESFNFSQSIQWPTWTQKYYLYKIQPNTYPETIDNGYFLIDISGISLSTTQSLYFTTNDTQYQSCNNTFPSETSTCSTQNSTYSNGSESYKSYQIKLENSKSNINIALIIKSQNATSVYYFNSNISIACNAGYLYNQTSKSCYKYQNACQQGYYKNQTSGQCLPCNTTMNFCDQCYGSTVCAKCNGTNVQLVNQKCECSSGYYINSNTNPPNCSPCLLHCSSCTTNTTCLQCEKNYVLNNEACILSCKPGSFPFPNPQEATFCYACQDNCISCTNNNDCTDCKDGYKWDEKSKKCTSTCSDGKFYDSQSSSCKDCSVSHCIQCDSATDCFKCEEGYHLDIYTCKSKNSAILGITVLMFLLCLIKFQ